MVVCPIVSCLPKPMLVKWARLKAKVSSELLSSYVNIGISVGLSRIQTATEGWVLTMYRIASVAVSFAIARMAIMSNEHTAFVHY